MGDVYKRQVQLFTVLSAESLNPDHPLHDEFMERMDNIWAHYSRYPWLVPPQLGSWEESMRPVVRKTMEIMDGIQLWWLREPEVDLCEMCIRDRYAIVRLRCVTTLRNRTIQYPL